MCPKNDPSNAKRHLYSQPQDGSRGKSLSWKFQYTLKRTENKQPHTWLYLHCCVLRAFVSKLLWFHHLLNWCNVLGSSSWSQQQEKNSEGLNMTAKKKKKKNYGTAGTFSHLPFPIYLPLCVSLMYRSGGAPSRSSLPSERTTHPTSCLSVSSGLPPAALTSRNCPGRWPHSLPVSGSWGCGARPQPPCPQKDLHLGNRFWTWDLCLKFGVGRSSRIFPQDEGGRIGQKGKLNCSSVPQRNSWGAVEPGWPFSTLPRETKPRGPLQISFSLCFELP